jgi:hypothetical protein
MPMMFFAALSYLLTFTIIEADGRQDRRLKILKLRTDHVASQIERCADRCGPAA